jgi:hypothetical protein
MASSGSRPLVDGCLRVLEIGHAESHRFTGDDFMRRVGQFDQHFVWARFQADYDHRLTARIDFDGDQRWGREYLWRSGSCSCEFSILVSVLRYFKLERTAIRRSRIGPTVSSDHHGIDLH